MYFFVLTPKPLIQTGVWEWNLPTVTLNPNNVFKIYANTMKQCDFFRNLSANNNIWCGW